LIIFVNELKELVGPLAG